MFDIRLDLKFVSQLILENAGKVDRTRERDQATRDDRFHGKRMHIICVGEEKLTEFDRSVRPRVLTRFIPLTSNREDDHFLDHFSAYLPHHFFPSYLPTRMKTNAARETAMRYTYIYV